MILSDELPHQEEIDIIAPYQRSTRILGNYVMLDWGHRQDIKNLITSVSLRINQSYIFKSCIFSILRCDSVPPNFMRTIYHNIVDI